MRSPRRVLLGLTFTIGLAGCSSSAGNRSDAAAFVAAPWPPPYPCGLLTVADLQAVLPNVSGMYHPDPLTPEGVLWIDGCQWSDRTTTPGHQIALSLSGALTPETNASFGAHVADTGGVDASVDTVSGLGTKAAYLNQTGVSQRLTVWFDSYLLTLSATGFTPDLPESSLEPLAVKVMGQLSAHQ